MTKEKEINKKELHKRRRQNARLYPIYKMFSWDLLFFYSIEFLFCTMAKKVSAAEVLMIGGQYLIFRIIGQFPAVIITDSIGKKKSIVLGNFLLIIFAIVLIYLPGAISIVIADFIYAIGYDLKILAETNLLYDSVSTKGGEGLYSKLDAKGGSLYYFLDGIASLIAGYLFVINYYLPMHICLGFLIISFILSLQFKEIYDVKKDKKREKNRLTEYFNDIKTSFKFIIKSKRMKAFVWFQIVFYSLIKIFDTYRSAILVDVGIPEEQFSMIMAVLTLVGGVSLTFKTAIEKKFKNRTLSFLTMAYIIACIIIGTLSTLSNNIGVIPIILIMLAIMKISTSVWYILEYKYLKNFTNENMRNKLTFTYEFIGGIAASIASVLGGVLLDVIDVRKAFLIVGLIGAISLVLVLDYMRSRFGLKPEEYKKEDLEF